MQRATAGQGLRPWPGRLRADGLGPSLHPAGREQAAASADAAAAVGATYSQAEVQAILDELRDLKAQLRAAGLLAP